MLELVVVRFCIFQSNNLGICTHYCCPIFGSSYQSNKLNKANQFYAS